MTVKSVIAKNTVYGVKCANCQEQIRRGGLIKCLYDERLVVHARCFDAVVEKISALKEEMG